MPPPPASAAPRRMTREFRRRMLRQAAALFGGLTAVLLVLAGTVDRRVFALAAFVLIPATALTFNFLQRRAYTASQRRR